MSASAFRVWCTADAALVDSRRVAPVRDNVMSSPPSLSSLPATASRNNNCYSAKPFYFHCCLQAFHQVRAGHVRRVGTVGAAAICHQQTGHWRAAVRARLQSWCVLPAFPLSGSSTRALTHVRPSPVSRPDMFQLLRLATQQLAFGDESKCPFSRSRPTRPRSVPKHGLGQRVQDAGAIAGPTRRRCGAPWTWQNQCCLLCCGCEAALVQEPWQQKSSGRAWRRETWPIVVCSPAVIPPCGALSLLAGQAGCY